MTLRITVKISDPAPRVPLWRYKDDLELWGAVRDAVDPQNPGGFAGAPAVFVLRETAVKLTDVWQKFLIAINIGMEAQYVSTLLGNTKAFTNATGFPGKKNYILNEDLDANEYPRFDKSRTCARSVFTGTKDGDFLIPDMLDGNQPPPEPLVINPRAYPWLFFAANNISAEGSIFPFANGAYYDWTPDPTKPYSFLPHVVEFENGKNPVRIPLSNLIQLPLGSRVPSPYIER
jgi:hypothetical protein